MPLLPNPPDNFRLHKEDDTDSMLSTIIRQHLSTFSETKEDEFELIDWSLLDEPKQTELIDWDLIFPKNTKSVDNTHNTSIHSTSSNLSSLFFDSDEDFESISTSESNNTENVVKEDKFKLIDWSEFELDIESPTDMLLPKEPSIQQISEDNNLNEKSTESAIILDQTFDNSSHSTNTDLESLLYNFEDFEYESSSGRSMTSSSELSNIEENEHITEITEVKEEIPKNLKPEPKLRQRKLRTKQRKQKQKRTRKVYRLIQQILKITDN